jgi:KaiC/GvpD/RAD55 family RecA-like ATPase
VNIANGGIGYDQLVRSGFNGGSILIAQGAKETFEKVFNDIFEMDDSMPQDVLRVVIIDPINAINTSETLGSRDALLSFISEARRRHLNVVATAESQVWVQDKAVELFEKLADVVIRLSRNDPTSGYSQRFLEIVKSRRQREQRGQHPYSIRSGTGIHVYPSSAAIAARYQERKSKRSEPDVFGWRPIDEILGPAAFLPGDVMVFRGPEGALKTELAVAFALCCGNRHGVARARACSLFVPLKDPVGFIQGLVSRKLRGSALVRTGDGDTLRSSENVEILDLPGGYIQPGVFFSILESKINEIRSRGNFVERIVFDNVEHWDSDCPFIAADPTFASTLVKLLRRRGITTLMVSHVLPETASTGRIQHSLLAAADVTIKFWRYDHAGKEQNAFRVVATRSMEHDWDQYSIYMEHRQLKVGVKAKQFRFEGSKATPVPVKLHLHSEGVIQEIYNNELAQSLRPVLARDVFVHADNQGRIVKWLDMQALAMVDQVQILELDEFQLPRAKKDLPELPRVLSEIRLANRRSQSFSKFVDELQHSLAERIKIPTGNAINTSTPKPLARYFAMPYYQNLGLLVINRAHSFWKTIAAGKKSNEDELTWESIARYAMMWEADSAKNDRLFFDFQSNKSETYISFFFEMAMGMGIETPQKGASLAEWFSGYKSLIKRLLANYWLLGHRAHRAHPEEYYRFDREGKVEHKKNWKKEDLESKPIFWRHWFTTAAELFAQFSPECWPMLEVRMLPGGGAVAGEWYLTIPASSAAPEFAAEIIKHLISKDDEIERLRLGVGLPVRASFYEMEEGGLDMLRCRYFSLPARETGERLSRALRRSDIRDYSSVSRLLSFHLKRVLELERDEAESALLARDWQGTGNDAIEGILDSLISGLTKIRIPD